MKGIDSKNADVQQKKYTKSLQNLLSGVFPPEVAKDIGPRLGELGELKVKIDTIMNMEPPKDYTVDTISAWLYSLKDAPDEKVFHLLIERIDVKDKTVLSISSTLKTVLGKHGCGGRI